MKSICIGTLALTASVAPILRAQGPLVPSGPPAPSMKDLGQLNAGNPITEPTTISDPGRYYLAANLSGEIVITSSRVVLDLNGFQIKPNPDQIAVLAESPTTPLHSVSVRNGSIDGGKHAVKFLNVCNGAIEDLSIVNTTDQAIQVSATSRSDRNRIARCSIVQCTGGIWILTENEASQCRGNSIRACLLSDIGPPFRPITLGGDGICSSNQVQDCLVGEAPGPGIELRARLSGRCEGSRVDRCATAENGGVDLVAVLGGTVSGTDVTRCTVSGSLDSAGISLAVNINNDPDSTVTGNRIERCVVTGSQPSGILLQGSSGNLVKGCVIHNTTTPDGFVGGSIFCLGSADDNRIVDNHMGVGGHGIWVHTSEEAFVSGNSIVDHATPFAQTTSVVTTGPIVTSAGTLTGPPSSDANPWANFAR